MRFIPYSALVLTCLISNLAIAAKLKTTVAFIDEATTHSESHRVYLSLDGVVAKIKNEDIGLLEGLKEVHAANLTVEVELNNDNFIEGVSLVAKTPKFKSNQVSQVSNSLVEYVPTVLNSMDEATEMFESMTTKMRNRSQCFNRAHVWTYNLYTSRRLNSQKVFMFFTSSYIRRFDYKWWFHVAPFVMVKNENGKVEEMVLDRTFKDEISTMKDWSDDFIKTKKACPTVAKYSDYELNQKVQDCYFIKTPMYTWEPTDIEKAETEGLNKLNWIQWELDTARKNALSWF
jgi:hypothetical protein